MSINVIRRVPYGKSDIPAARVRHDLPITIRFIYLVRLGKSGLKVSRIILGCMSYGTPEWQRWVLGEEEGIAQIKFACVIIIFKAEAPLVDFDFDPAAGSFQFGTVTRTAFKPSTPLM